MSWCRTKDTVRDVADIKKRYKEPCEPQEAGGRWKVSIQGRSLRSASGVNIPEIPDQCFELCMVGDLLIVREDIIICGEEEIEKNFKQCWLLVLYIGHAER